MTCQFLKRRKHVSHSDVGLEAGFTIPVVADVGEHTQHLVQVGGHGVSPSLGELRVVIGTRGLVHPARRRVAVERANVAFHRGEFQLQLPHEGTELAHEELQSRGFLGAGATAATTAAYS